MYKMERTSINAKKSQNDDVFHSRGLFDSDDISLNTLISILTNVDELVNLDKSLYQLYLTRLNLYAMDYEKRRTVHSDMINALVELDNAELFSSYVEIMSENDGEDYPYTVQMLMLPLINKSIIYLSQLYDYEFYETARAMLQELDPDTVFTGLTNLKKIFSDVYMMETKENADIFRQTIIDLYDVAKSKTNATMMEYFGDMLKKIGVYAPVPAWVDYAKTKYTQKQLEELLEQYLIINDMFTAPDVAECGSPEEDTERLIAIMQEHADAGELDFDALREDTLATFKDKSEKERYDFFEWIENNNFYMQLSNDVSIFEVHGPCLLDPKGYTLKAKSKSDICTRFGGCRMFTCVCRENKRKDWFKGICDNESCGIHIAKKCYAVRMPLETGGWFGCYCSFDCVRENIPKEKHATFDIVNGYEEVMTKVRVYDRN